MNIYIGFTTSPKRYEMIRIRVVLNYFSSFTNDDLITFLPSSNMMVRLALFPSAISVIVPSPKTLCLILSPMSKSAIYLFLLIYANITRMANMMMTIMCTGIYLVFDFFHFQKKYKPTPDRAYTPMNIYWIYFISKEVCDDKA